MDLMEGNNLGENITREWNEDPRAPELWDALELTKSDPKKGVKELRELAEEGSQLAQLYLADILLKGKYGFEKDKTDGLHWLSLSANGGSIEGTYNLGWHLLNSGELEASLAMYERAADLGYSPAFYVLGSLYNSGARVPRDDAKAFAYFRQGEAMGHFFALNRANRMRIKGHVGLMGRLQGIVGMAVMFVPFLRAWMSYRNSDRLRR